MSGTREGRAGTTQANIDPARVARQLRHRLDARAAWQRVVDSMPAIVQITAAAVAAYAISHYLVGHRYPLLSVTTVISSLGLARNAKPRQTVETILGMLVGILLSATLLALVGSGVWQLLIVLLLVMLVARALSPNPAFAAVAAVQSVLIMVLPPPVGGPIMRVVDASVGLTMALVVTVLLPRDPRAGAVRDGRALFAVLRESLGLAVDALSTGDGATAELGLERLRRTQPLIDRWASSLEAAKQLVRISPLLRRHRAELVAQERLQLAADLAVRHLRVIIRRVEFLVRDDGPRPELAALLGELGEGIRLLGEEVGDRSSTGAARTLFSDLAERLDPASVLEGASLRDATIVLLLRSLLVDLLVGSGATPEQARGLLPALDD